MVSRDEEKKEEKVMVQEVEITKSLINDKLNFIITLLQNQKN